MCNLLNSLALQVQMADALRQDGKFWVVVAVIFSALAGLAIYLVMLDRKIAVLEKRKEEEKNL